MGEPVTLRDGLVTLEGILNIPPGDRGLVLFAHGSGSSRHSPRNGPPIRRLSYGSATLHPSGRVSKTITLEKSDKGVQKNVVHYFGYHYRGDPYEILRHPIESTWAWSLQKVNSECKKEGLS